MHSEGFSALVDLLAAGTRLSAQEINAACRTAGVGPGELALALLRRVNSSRCDCGGTRRVYATRLSGTARVQYWRCPGCGGHGKLCTTPVVKSA